MHELQDDAVYIGHRSGWDDSPPVSLQCEDRRQHVYVIGKTGSGKSTLLRNMIVQHIAAGDGVGLIDPHGATLRTNCSAAFPRRARSRLSISIRRTLSIRLR